MANPVVKMEVENFGTMTLELYPDKAPETVKNFLNLAKSGFYNGLIFHRVIKGFMIQGGGYTPDFGETDCRTIHGEFASNGCFLNDLKHTKGVISMARTNVKDSASSQFFIMHENAPHLDGQYAAFGKVTEGIEVVDKIADVRTGNYGYFGDVPKTPVVIKSVEVVSE